MSSQEEVKLKCVCGWEGTDQGIEWDYDDKDPDSLKGYCPGCKEEWHVANPIMRRIEE
jgi:hypothetical protein